MNVPLARPHLGPEEAAAVQEVLASGWLVQGPRVAGLEARLSALMDAHVVCTSSCTTALHLLLSALGIGPGDGVIVPSYTFVATANAVLYCGATPVFADIDPATYNMDPAATGRVIEAAGKPDYQHLGLGADGRIRAIMPVHQVGLPCDLAAFRALADRHGLLLVEDAAPALGATYDGHLVGHKGGYGKGVCFSMHTSKAIVAGEGGFVVTADGDVAETIRSTRQHGANIGVEHRQRQGGYVQEAYTRLGWNARMSDMHAAVGLVQVGRMAEIVAWRRLAASTYRRLFADDGRVTRPTPAITPSGKPYSRKAADWEETLSLASFQRYLVRVRDHATRERVLAHLLASGVSARRGIQTVHREPYFVERYGAQSLPVTEAVADTSLQLPLWPTISEAEQRYVVEKVREGLAG